MLIQPTYERPGVRFSFEHLWPLSSLAGSKMPAPPSSEDIQRSVSFTDDMVGPTGGLYPSGSCDLINTTAAVAAYEDGLPGARGEVEPKSAATAYHLGIPNFKMFLSLRFALGVWALFLGAFYEEILGWSMGLLLLAVALVQTAARIRPSLWTRYRKSIVVVDLLSAALALLGCANASLVKGLFCFALPFVLVQLAVQMFVWPNPRVHPFCYPTFKKLNCGTVSNDICAKSRENMAMPTWKWKKFPFFLVWTAVIGLFLLVVSVTGQRLMIYPGTLFKVRIPDDFPVHLGLDVELVSFFTADRKRLSALFMKPTQQAEKDFDASKKPRLTMWIFYGNTGNMVHQLDFVVPLMQKAYPNLQFFIFSYRGYANSDGRPHIAGLRKDIDAAVDYLRRRADVDKARIVSYGHSIGGALVSDVLGRHPGFLKSVILSNTFLSMRKMADTWRVSLLHPFISETWDSESAFKKAVRNGSLPPILFMSSEQDELIPAYHMRGLYEIARQAPVNHTFLSLPRGLHNYWNDELGVHLHWVAFFANVANSLPNRK